jgi:predicted DNA-binding ribbon-helix-helix protein
MKSPVIKRSIVIAGHKTSVSLEDAFWKGLKDIAVGRRTTLSDLVASIDTGRRYGNLSSAIRLFVLDHFQAHPDSHGEGGNGDGDHGESPRSRRVMVLAPAADPPVLRPE